MKLFILFSVMFTSWTAFAGSEFDVFKKFSLSCVGYKRSWGGGGSDRIELKRNKTDDGSSVSGQIDDITLDAFMRTPQEVYIAINKINGESSDGLKFYNRLATTTAKYYKGLEVKAETRDMQNGDNGMSDYSVECKVD